MHDSAPGNHPFAALTAHAVEALIEPMTTVASRALGGSRRHGEDVARNLIQGLADGVEGARAFEHAIDGISRVRGLAGLEVCTDEHRVAAELSALYLEAHVAGWAEEPTELGFRQSLTWAGVPGRVALQTPRPRWRLPTLTPQPTPEVEYEARLLESDRSGAWARVAAHRNGREVAEVAVFRATTVVSVDGCRLSVADPDGDHAVRFVERVVALMDGQPLAGVDLREMLRLGRETLEGEVAA